MSLTAVQTTTVADLRPGGAAQNLSGNFTNPAANGPVYVTSVTASISSVVKAGGAVAGTCDATDYTLSQRCHGRQRRGADRHRTGRLGRSC